MPDLLIELFSEEIPARMQARAAEDLRRLVTDGLAERGLACAAAASFATPRRLTLAAEGLPAGSAPVREERRGPREGAPENAIEGFCRSAGVPREALELREEKKGRFWFAVIERPGRPADEIVAEVLEETIRNFPWPKSMRWGTHELRWVRPLHAILCILSDESGARVVPLAVDGIASGDVTRGHRFMAPDPFSVGSFEDYAAKLKRAKVLLSTDERKDAIRAGAEALCFARGLELVEDRRLLDEVAGLVEWPVPLLGEIDPAFHDLPPEVLQTSMREHQKFFSVREPGSGRITHFVTVAGRETPDDGATILAGNRKVLFARLSDARFFWENDLAVAREGMKKWREALENVTFHRDLGSQGERVRRLVALAREIAPAVGADADLSARAAELAKLDLASEMVYEFPELQGIMGRYYAEAAGEPAEVARAIAEHYAPQGPEDDVPSEPVSVAVALADKLDLLCAMWSIGEKPTGSKDPFALRRAALGLIRIILTNGLRLRLDRFIDAQLLRLHVQFLGEMPQEARKALMRLIDEVADKGVFRAAFDAVRERVMQDVDGQEDHPAVEMLDRLGRRVPDISVDLLSFLHERLKVHLRERGIRHDVIDACIAMPGNDDLTLLVRRAEALQDVLATEDGQNLLQGFRRANNILTQAEEKDGVTYSFGADPKFAEDPAEKALFEALAAQRPRIEAALEAEDFVTATTELARLRGPIDAFFEAVQVNTDNQIVRRNRLNLLSEIRDLCLRVADLRRIEG